MKKGMLSVTIATILTSATLCACGKPTTVEGFISGSSEKKQMDQMVDNMVAQNSTTFSDVKYNVSGNTIEYDYYLKTAIPVQGKIDVDSMTKSQLDSLIKQFKDGGVKGDVTIIYVYYNPDGAEAVRIEYTN